MGTGSYFYRRLHRHAVAIAMASLVWIGHAVDARAQSETASGSRDLDLDTFRPALRTGPALIAIDSPETGAAGEWAMGLFFHYASDPLVVEATDQSGDVDTPVEHRSVTMLAGALSMGAIEIGASVPFIQQSGRDPRFSGIEPANGTTLGNASLRGKASILTVDPIAVSFAAEVAFPTSQSGMFAAAETPSIHGSALVGMRQGPLDLVANTGVRLRETRVIADVEQGHELTYGLGAAYAVSEEVAVVSEATGAVGIDARSTSAVSPLEVTAGIRYWPERRVGLVAGVGRGLMSGVGSPRFRGFALVSVAPGRKQAGADAVAPGDGPVEVPPEAAQPAEDEEEPVAPEDFECAEGDGPPQGCPAGDEALVLLLADRIETFESLRFAEGSAEILPGSYNLLAHVADTLREEESIRLTIEAHVHPSGDGDADRALTEARAEAVATWLAARGVERERLSAQGLGGEWPLVAGDDERARGVNERLEFVVERP